MNGWSFLERRDLSERSSQKSCFTSKNDFLDAKAENMHNNLLVTSLNIFELPYEWGLKSLVLFNLAKTIPWWV